MNTSYEPIRVELTDTEWMSLIDGERPDGLQRCCANISELRDVLIGAARNGGEFHMFEVERLRLTLGWAMDGHDMDGIPALDKIRAALNLAGKPPHMPDHSEVI